jgi:PHP family Zn ribbon phosphoesterase
MLGILRADLHVHTVLSPCAEVEMIPPLIVRRALELGLGIIAITDHNSAENVAAVMEAAQGTGLVVLPGMEVQTREEVHLLCLFDTLEQVLTMQGRVYNHLPPLKNNAEVFGAQFVVDAEGDFVRENERLLLTSTSLSVEEVVQRVQELVGLCIPAHIDRPSYSLIANLGFIPKGLEFPALEMSRHANPSEVRRIFPDVADRSLIVSGDAHRLQEMTARTAVRAEAPTTHELTLAFAGRQGRAVIVDCQHIQPRCQCPTVS